MCRLALVLACLAALAAGQAQQDTTFDAPPARVIPSPEGLRSIPLPAGAQAAAIAAAADRPRAAVVLRGAGGDEIQLWDAGAAATALAWRAPAGLNLTSVVWDPAAERLYAVGRRGARWEVLRLDAAAPEWKAATIYSGGRELSHLVIGPRPFDVGERLFFGERMPNGANRVLSVTVAGKRLYQVIGPEATAIAVGDPRNDMQPTTLPAPNALPAGFYPAGNRLLWQDGRGCFQSADYGHMDWEKLAPVDAGRICGGALTVTPNGLGLVHWTADTPGVTLILRTHPGPEAQAVGEEFALPPAPAPDGRGLLGVTRSGGKEFLAYVPIQVPLADVANAWMFVTGPDEADHFRRDQGLFRPYAAEPGSPDQLYSFYDTELYHCGGYDDEIPTRPYLVTSDLLWEVYGAAFHGLFTLSERQQALPAFWRFVDAAEAELRRQPNGKRWAAVFATLQDLHRAHPLSAEARRVIAAKGSAMQPQFGAALDYSQFQPRGFYAGDPALESYFRAFRYLTAVAAVADDLAPLAALSPSSKRLALSWIGAYAPFLAPPHQPLIWGGAGLAGYARHPGRHASVFPTSWGFDNEVLDSTIEHTDWPTDEQITGAKGPRLLPSGLDVAAALGNGLAQTLLEPQLREYGRLGPVLGRLQGEVRAGALDAAGGSFYTQWLRALRTQWSAPPQFADGPGAPLWDAKRLETGLASWATLRHTTVLVNDESAAECGEGGFEELITTPPRGYVEPDPATFGAIAGLFDAMAARIAASPAVWSGAAPDGDDFFGDSFPNEPLRQGVLRRLREAAANARRFQSMARKEIAGQQLSPADYQAILYAGRAGEYDFLVFKSLANRNYALSIPDPLPKIADVAGNARTGYLEAAVGDGMEWDQVVPYFGRHEIVKGSIYSYREVAAPQPLTDADWRARMAAAPPPRWLARFLVATPLVCPAVSPF